MKAYNPYENMLNTLDVAAENSAIPAVITKYCAIRNGNSRSPFHYSSTTAKYAYTRAIVVSTPHCAAALKADSVSTLIPMKTKCVPWPHG